MVGSDRRASAGPAGRAHLALAAAKWSAISLAWATFAGVSALFAGLASSSVALVAFGANSLLDATASGVLVWRFRHEYSGGDAHTVERRAAILVGVVMTGVGLYLIARAISALGEHHGPDSSAFGVALTAAATLVLPLLARAKIQLAGALNSPGLRGDGVLSLAGAVLAAATLASSLLDTSLDWWWADSVAALLIACMLLLEGPRTVASARQLVR
jgi:divalent metal cation (Fe/Co/Zn/Cd) transporter